MGKHMPLDIFSHLSFASFPVSIWVPLYWDISLGRRKLQPTHSNKILWIPDSSNIFDIKIFS